MKKMRINRLFFKWISLMVIHLLLITQIVLPSKSLAQKIDLSLSGKVETNKACGAPLFKDTLAPVSFFKLSTDIKAEITNSFLNTETELDSPTKKGKSFFKGIIKKLRISKIKDQLNLRIRTVSLLLAGSIIYLLLAIFFPSISFSLSLDPNSVSQNFSSEPYTPKYEVIIDNDSGWKHYGLRANFDLGTINWLDGSFNFGTGMIEGNPDFSALGPSPYVSAGYEDLANEKDYIGIFRGGVAGEYERWLQSKVYSEQKNNYTSFITSSFYWANAWKTDFISRNFFLGGGALV
ncbi:hypothetical protein ACFLQ1_02830 [Candidatus Auribacterota bacterium]